MSTCAHCGLETDQSFRFCPRCGTQQLGDTPHPFLGRTLAGKYRVLEQLGSGSMGTVYLAEHIALRKRIALKILHRELELTGDALRRLQREGIAAVQVGHPNVIQVFDFDKTDDGTAFLAMEYVEGVDLKAFLAARGPLAPEEAVELTRQLLSTLTEAHKHGIVHRDLKPENLMVVESAGGVRVLKVLDFGLSKLVDRQIDASHRTLPGRVLGTPLYMAPEQWRGEPADHRTDLYAVTLILYEMVAGRPPFKSSDITQVMSKTANQPPPSLHDAQPGAPVAVELDAIVRKGLAKSRDARFQSADEMLEELDRARLDRVRTRAPRRSTTRATRERAPATETPRRRIGAWLAGGALLAVLAVVLFVVFGGGDGAAAAKEPLVRLRPESARTVEERGYLTLLDEAREALRKRDFAQATMLCGKAINMPCADAEAYATRARVYRARGDADTATADYEDALRLHPRYGEAAAGVGWILFDRKRFDEADARFSDALTRQPDCADAIAGRAAVLLQRGDAAAARDLLDRAAQAQPAHALVQLWRGRAHLALDQLDTATASFVEAKRRDSGLAEAAVGLGDAYARKGSAALAEAQYLEALDIEPTPEVRQRLAELLVAAERWESAEKVLEPALRDRPEDGALHLLSGLVAQGRGARATAISAFDRALAKGVSDSSRVRALLATMCFQEQRWADALAHARVALEDRSAPPNVRAAALTTSGLAQWKLDNHTAAAEDLQQAVAIEPASTLALYHLGVLYMDYFGDAGRAKTYLKAYRDAGGDDPRVVEWLRKLE
jgi:tetratricopeptide (TPR) repeat protein/tRNA A-37 threonylcarbamoyl transferase component Bud32